LCPEWPEVSLTLKTVQLVVNHATIVKAAS